MSLRKPKSPLMWPLIIVLSLAATGATMAIKARFAESRAATASVRAEAGGLWCLVPGTNVEVFLPDDWGRPRVFRYGVAGESSLIASTSRGMLEVAPIDRFRLFDQQAAFGHPRGLDHFIDSAARSPDGVHVGESTLAGTRVLIGVNPSLGIGAFTDSAMTPDELQTILSEKR